MKRKKRHIGDVQGHALLYGRSSRAIRIVNGVEVGKVDNQRHSPKKLVVSKKQTPKVQAQKVQVHKKHQMDEKTKMKLDNLQDPLEMMSKYKRAQKYEAKKSNEEYEYGLSDW